MKVYAFKQFQGQTDQIIEQVVTTEKPVEVMADHGSVVLLTKADYQKFLLLRRAKLIDELHQILPDDVIKTVNTDAEFEKWWHQDESMDD